MADSDSSSSRETTPVPVTSGMREPKSIAVEIVSDTICPFCYLGYKKILAAIDQVKLEAKQYNLPLSFSIRFKPFMLDPTLPTDHGISKRDRYIAKFGADKVDAITTMMAERGKPWGINFSYGGSIRNTYSSHRLVEKAWEEGGEKLQTRVVEKLFEGYFENEKDIGDHAWLAEVAVGCDLFEKKEEALDFLKSDELKKETCDEIRKAQSMGISGVPFTVINDKYAVSGAQEPQAFVDVFRKIACGKCPCEKPQ